MTRYEIKLVGRALDLHRIRSDLRRLPACLRQLHPSRHVQSMYFDTWSSQAVRENLAGISQRQKIRMRWYGEGTGQVMANLECKKRNNSLGDKDVFALDAPIQVAGSCRRKLTSAVTAAMPAAARPLMLGMEPVQWIRYQRDYLGTADGRLRITIDHDLTAFEQRFGSRIQDQRRTLLPEIVVVEIKADATDGHSISQWLQGIPLRPSKCSKFMLAHQPRSAVASSDW